jgi:hypothetical protein
LHYPPTLNTGFFAGHNDWRLPFISELQSTLIGPYVTTVANADPPDPASGTNPTGQATTCGTVDVPSCIDPDFAAVGGPTASSLGGVHSLHWSASSPLSLPDFAWEADFENGPVGFNFKVAGLFVRAVRAGSCVN